MLEPTANLPFAVDATTNVSRASIENHQKAAQAELQHQENHRRLRQIAKSQTALLLAYDKWGKPVSSSYPRGNVDISA